MCFSQHYALVDASVRSDEETREIANYFLSEGISSQQPVGLPQSILPIVGFKVFPALLSDLASSLFPPSESAFTHDEAQQSTNPDVLKGASRQKLMKFHVIPLSNAILKAPEHTYTPVRTPQAYAGGPSPIRRDFNDFLSPDNRMPTNNGYPANGVQSSLSPPSAMFAAMRSIPSDPFTPTGKGTSAVTASPLSPDFPIHSNVSSPPVNANSVQILQSQVEGKLGHTAPMHTYSRGDPMSGNAHEYNAYNSPNSPYGDVASHLMNPYAEAQNSLSPLSPLSPVRSLNDYITKISQEKSNLFTGASRQTEFLNTEPTTDQPSSRLHAGSTGVEKWEGQGKSVAEAASGFSSANAQDKTTGNQATAQSPIMTLTPQNGKITYKTEPTTSTAASGKYSYENDSRPVLDTDTTTRKYPTPPATEPLETMSTLNGNNNSNFPSPAHGKEQRNSGTLHLSGTTVVSMDDIDVKGSTPNLETKKLDSHNTYGGVHFHNEELDSTGASLDGLGLPDDNRLQEKVISTSPIKRRKARPSKRTISSAEQEGDNFTRLSDRVSELLDAAEQVNPQRSTGSSPKPEAKASAPSVAQAGSGHPVEVQPAPKARKNRVVIPEGHIPPVFSQPDANSAKPPALFLLEKFPQRPSHPSRAATSSISPPRDDRGRKLSFRDLEVPNRSSTPSAGTTAAASADVRMRKAQTPAQYRSVRPRYLDPRPVRSLSPGVRVKKTQPMDTDRLETFFQRQTRAAKVKQQNLERIRASVRASELGLHVHTYLHPPPPRNGVNPPFRTSMHNFSKSSSKLRPASTSPFRVSRMSQSLLAKSKSKNAISRHPRTAKAGKDASVVIAKFLAKKSRSVSAEPSKSLSETKSLHTSLEERIEAVEKLAQSSAPGTDLYLNALGRMARAELKRQEVQDELQSERDKKRSNEQSNHMLQQRLLRECIASCVWLASKRVVDAEAEAKKLREQKEVETYCNETSQRHSGAIPFPDALNGSMDSTFSTTFSRASVNSEAGDDIAGMYMPWWLFPLTPFEICTMLLGIGCFTVPLSPKQAEEAVLHLIPRERSSNSERGSKSASNDPVYAQDVDAPELIEYKKASESEKQTMRSLGRVWHALFLGVYPNAPIPSARHFPFIPVIALVSLVQQLLTGSYSLSLSTLIETATAMHLTSPIVFCARIRNGLVPAEPGLQDEQELTNALFGPGMYSLAKEQQPPSDRSDNEGSSISQDGSAIDPTIQSYFKAFTYGCPNIPIPPLGLSVYAKHTEYSSLRYLRSLRTNRLAFSVGLQLSDTQPALLAGQLTNVVSLSSSAPPLPDYVVENVKALLHSTSQSHYDPKKNNQQGEDAPAVGPLRTKPTVILRTKTHAPFKPLDPSHRARLEKFDPHADVAEEIAKKIRGGNDKRNHAFLTSFTSKQNKDMYKRHYSLSPNRRVQHLNEPPSPSSLFSYAPTLNTKSLKLADETKDKRVEQLLRKAGTSDLFQLTRSRSLQPAGENDPLNISLEDRLVLHKRVREKQAQLKLMEKEMEALRECTFQPNTRYVSVSPVRPAPVQKAVRKGGGLVLSDPSSESEAIQPAQPTRLMKRETPASQSFYLPQFENVIATAVNTSKLPQEVRDSVVASVTKGKGISYGPSGRNNDAHFKNTASRHEFLYQLAQKRRQALDTAEAVAKALREEESLAECTFQPNANRAKSAGAKTSTRSVSARSGSVHTRNSSIGSYSRPGSEVFPPSLDQSFATEADTDDEVAESEEYVALPLPLTKNTVTVLEQTGVLAAVSSADPTSGPVTNASEAGHFAPNAGTADPAAAPTSGSSEPDVTYPSIPLSKTLAQTPGMATYLSRALTARAQVESHKHMQEALQKGTLHRYRRQTRAGAKNAYGSIDPAPIGATVPNGPTLCTRDRAIAHASRKEQQLKKERDEIEVIQTHAQRRQQREQEARKKQLERMEARSIVFEATSDPIPSIPILNASSSNANANASSLKKSHTTIIFEPSSQPSISFSPTSSPSPSPVGFPSILSHSHSSYSNSWGENASAHSQSSFLVNHSFPSTNHALLASSASVPSVRPASPPHTNTTAGTNSTYPSSSFSPVSYSSSAASIHNPNVHPAYQQSNFASNIPQRAPASNATSPMANSAHGNSFIPSKYSSAALKSSATNSPLTMQQLATSSSSSAIASTRPQPTAPITLRAGDRLDVAGGPVPAPPAPAPSSPPPPRPNALGKPEKQGPQDGFNIADKAEKDQPLLYVDVTVKPGATHRIALHENSDLSAVSADFVAKHQLPLKTLGKLENLLRTQRDTVLAKRVSAQ